MENSHIRSKPTEQSKLLRRELYYLRVRLHAAVIPVKFLGRAYSSAVLLSSHLTLFSSGATMLAQFFHQLMG